MRLRSLALLPLAALFAAPASAFCGFYVAKADTRLFNKASKVVLVRDEDRTVLTMANDYQGDPKEFAIVIPVPTVLEREQIHVGDPKIVDHLDAYTAPRLVEYYDDDPCARRFEEEKSYQLAPRAPLPTEAARDRAKSLGVTIEAAYTVGEYDILILSAKESDGLETWLRESGYRVPDGASRILGSYLRQGLRFFVAKVNLREKEKLGYSYLRPLQMAYESPRFMLPIRLGTVNADGPQELFVFALTRTGRVETTNYRTVRLPTGVEVPGFVKDDFANFYRDMFRHQVEKEEMRAVFLEYAWDMNWCDPCAAEPLSPSELRQLGVFWLDDGRDLPQPRPRPGFAPPRPTPAADAFVTRLHVRYTADRFPEDLVFQSTGDRENFQGRYVIYQPFTGELRCAEGRRYVEDLRRRREQWARNLADLTGWQVGDVRGRMGADPTDPESRPWWKKIWGEGSGR